MRKVWIAAGGLAGLVAVAVVVLVVLGRRKGAGRNDYTLEIARPPADVYTWIAEPAKLKQWVGWLEEVRRDPPGPDGVVRREVWVMNDPNSKSKMELVTDNMRVEPGRLVEARVSTPPMFSGEVSYALTDLGNGRTRLDYRSHFTYGPWYFRLIEPLVTPEAQKKLVMDLETMKRLAEAERAG